MLQMGKICYHGEWDEVINQEKLAVQNYFILENYLVVLQPGANKEISATTCLSSLLASSYLSASSSAPPPPSFLFSRRFSTISMRLFHYIEIL